MSKPDIAETIFSEIYYRNTGQKRGRWGIDVNYKKPSGFKPSYAGQVKISEVVAPDIKFQIDSISVPTNPY